MSLKMTIPTLIAMMLAAGAAQAAGDVEKGKQQFAKCAICHATSLKNQSDRDDVIAYLETLK